MQSANVNVTGTSDFFTLLKYLLYLLLLVGGLYCVLHGIVQLTSGYVSYSTVDKVLRFLPRQKIVSDSAGEYAQQVKKIETLKDRYFFEDGFSGKDFSVEFVDNPEVNAALLPSKQIVFTKGTLKEVTEEEQLLFILAHEIGHYKNKDIFKSVVEITVASLLLQLFSNERPAVNTTEWMILHYSRAQEFAADCFAASKLKQIYGTADGGRRFFEYLEKKEHIPQWKQYFATHPSHVRRMANLERCAS